MSTHDLILLKSLAVRWQAAKADEEAARARRLDIEAGIYIAHGFSPSTTGTFTVPMPGGELKIACALVDKWDHVKLAEIRQNVPEQMFPFDQVVTFKPDARGIKYLRNNEPETFEQIAPALTQTPRKPAFKFSPAKG